MHNPSLYTSEELASMRGWISDCNWSDLGSDDLDELTDAQVVAGVSRHYDGGLGAFLLDAIPVQIR